MDYLSPKDGPVLEGFESLETVYAKDQPQYKPLRTLKSPGVMGRVISRWSPTPEQRQAIAEGEDIFLELLTFHGPLAPSRVFIGDDTDAEEILDGILRMREEVIHAEN